jgi:dissimilatory sulfite reductase related protein
MGYMINGEEFEYDDEKFLVEPNYDDEAPKAIAAEEGLTLTDEHWMVIEFLRRKYKEDGQTPNFRNFIKEMDEEHPGLDWKKKLYDLFPMQPARQAVRVAALPKPYGKGGY